MSTRKTKRLDSNATYRDFLLSINPAGIALSGLACQLDRGAYLKARKAKKGAVRTILTDYKLLEAEGGYFDSSADFTLSVAESDRETPALTIKCTYLAHLHCAAPVDAELAKRFTDYELRLVLWPFFRELVFDLCGKFSIAPITIPLSKEE